MYSINLTYANRRDLRDQPIGNREQTWFTAGSSCVKKGVTHAGYAIVTPGETIKAKALLLGNLVQVAKLIALTRAL